MTSPASYTCPVCAWAELTSPPYAVWPPPEGLDLRPPYEEQLGMPSYEVCEQCKFEFGNDDDPGGDTKGDTFDEYRAAWISRGRPGLRAEAERGSAG